MSELTENNPFSVCSSSGMAIPDGWRLMPILHNGKAPCTHEMADAFDSAYEEHSKVHGFYESMNAGYNAMVRVAPKPVVLHVADDLLVQLFYAAQGDITQFRIKARTLLAT